ncbi:hypothetical protein OsI_22798 [Oryza sativa Indica Group]|uniref:Uncharacterized protein n=1 Tax=Oryza sativa subsp. indica TaxID=39946 RepID=B8B1B8_ORYSI|nr:hypothetical protein OsI_22798 [Oryza sativa Indica Group]
MRASSLPDPAAGAGAAGGGSGESGGGAANPAQARRRQRRRACDHHHCRHALVWRMAEAICICSMNSSSVCLWYGMDVAGQGRADVEIFLKAAGYLECAIQHALLKISPEKRWKGLPVDLTEGILKAICMQAQGQCIYGVEVLRRRARRGEQHREKEKAAQEGDGEVAWEAEPGEAEDRDPPHRQQRAAAGDLLQAPQRALQEGVRAVHALRRLRRRRRLLLRRNFFAFVQPTVDAVVRRFDPLHADGADPAPAAVEDGGGGGDDVVVADPEELDALRRAEEQTKAQVAAEQARMRDVGDKVTQAMAGRPLWWEADVEALGEAELPEFVRALERLRDSVHRHASTLASTATPLPPPPEQEEEVPELDVSDYSF